jgi:hypothetical protein
MEEWYDKFRSDEFLISIDSRLPCERVIRFGQLGKDCNNSFWDPESRLSIFPGIPKQGMSMKELCWDMPFPLRRMCDDRSEHDNNFNFWFGLSVHWSECQGYIVPETMTIFCFARALEKWHQKVENIEWREACPIPRLFRKLRGFRRVLPTKKQNRSFSEIQQVCYCLVIEAHLLPLVPTYQMDSWGMTIPCSFHRQLTSSRSLFFWSVFFRFGILISPLASTEQSQFLNCPWVRWCFLRVGIIQSSILFSRFCELANFGWTANIYAVICTDGISRLPSYMCPRKGK